MFKNVTLIVALVAILIVMVLPLPPQSKTVVVVALLLGIVFFKRGYLYVAIASRALNGKKPDEEKAWRYYEKGWQAGLSPTYTVMLGNLFVQRGDAVMAARILDSVIAKEERRSKPNAGVLANARTSRSMAYWVLGDIDSAIRILQQVRQEGGPADKNLYINLGSYLLEQHLLDDAWEVIEEAAAKMPESPGMIDNRGWYLLLSGAMESAEKLYDELIDDSKPRFPEAYVHAAQVKTALGNIPKARGLYEEALTKPFYHTTGVSKEEIQKMLTALDSIKFNSEKFREEREVEELEEVLYDEVDLLMTKPPTPRWMMTTILNRIPTWRMRTTWMKMIPWSTMSWARNPKSTMMSMRTKRITANRERT